MTPAEVRSLFPITASRAYLFSGGLAPAAAPVKAALDRWSKLWALDPGYLYAHFQDEWSLARERFAAIIGGQPDEIAITDNTSRGSNLAVLTLDTPPGSNVVVDDYTYPSSLYPWQLPAKSHVEIRRVPARDNRVLFEDIAKVVDDRTIAISVTHVSNKTGFRHDLARLGDLADTRNAFLIVDAAQSAGVVEIDVRRMGVDFLSCSAMKWLCGTPGVGYLYVAREHADRLLPPIAGPTNTVRSAYGIVDGSLAFRDGARRYELGMPSLPGLPACREAMDILLRAGIKQIEHHVLDLTGYCIEQLLRRNFHLYTRAEPEYRAGIIAMPVRQGEQLREFLRERAVDVWTEDQHRLLRIDPHIFNNRGDIDCFLAGLDEFIHQHGSP